VRFVVDEVPLEQIFPLPPLMIIPPLFHTDLSPTVLVYDSPDQAAHYQILDLHL
jgi:hypothetical protein